MVYRVLQSDVFAVVLFFEFSYFACPYQRHIEQNDIGLILEYHRYYVVVIDQFEYLYVFAQDLLQYALDACYNDFGRLVYKYFYSSHLCLR